MRIQMDTLLKQFDIYQSLQSNFNIEMCQEIFNKDWEHYWKKWENSKCNIITFISSLDISKRRILFSHVLMNNMYKN